ncbi:hypothetical protein [Nonomuraea sp. NPDC049158]|uniref:hypothetical protein n=1 Tax=Nonomuraea sp. NPDC049158 TaxID=3155649 RepID=UPI00340FCD9B
MGDARQGDKPRAGDAGRDATSVAVMNALATLFARTERRPGARHPEALFARIARQVLTSLIS